MENMPNMPNANGVIAWFPLQGGTKRLCLLVWPCGMSASANSAVHVWFLERDPTNGKFNIVRTNKTAADVARENGVLPPNFTGFMLYGTEREVRKDDRILLSDLRKRVEEMRQENDEEEVNSPPPPCADEEEVNSPPPPCADEEEVKRAKADAKKAEANLKKAEAKVKRAEADAKKAEANLKKAKAKVKRAEANLKKANAEAEAKRAREAGPSGTSSRKSKGPRTDDKAKASGTSSQKRSRTPENSGGEPGKRAKTDDEDGDAAKAEKDVDEALRCLEDSNDRKYVKRMFIRAVNKLLNVDLDIITTTRSTIFCKLHPDKAAHNNYDRRQRAIGEALFKRYQSLLKDSLISP